MAGTLLGMFKDENDRKQMVELVADYSKSNPELLPALRQVVQYGFLYDQKLKVFLDMLKKERRRQKHLSGNEGYETDYPQNTEVSICSTEPSPVQKKRKKKKKHDDSIAGPCFEETNEILSEETVIPKTDHDHSENSESLFFIDEGGPPAKKKKKKRKKKKDEGVSGSVESHLTLPNGYSVVSNVAGENLSDIKPKNEAEANPSKDIKPKNEAEANPTFYDNVLINTVVANQNGICCKAQPVSDTEQTPRRRPDSTTEAGTPFRVIPSVQLMEDPARFPDLIPSPALPDTSTRTMSKWLVTIEFDSSVAQFGTLTEAEVYSALEAFHLKNIRVMQMRKSVTGSYLVKVEFFSTDFYRVFFDRQPSIKGVTGRVTETKVLVVTDEPSSRESNDLCFLDSSEAVFESNVRIARDIVDSKEKLNTAEFHPIVSCVGMQELQDEQSNFACELQEQQLNDTCVRVQEMQEQLNAACIGEQDLQEQQSNVACVAVQDQQEQQSNTSCAGVQEVQEQDSNATYVGAQEQDSNATCLGVQKLQEQLSNASCVGVKELQEQKSNAACVGMQEQQLNATWVGVQELHGRDSNATGFGVQELQAQHSNATSVGVQKLQSNATCAGVEELLHLHSGAQSSTHYLGNAPSAHLISESPNIDPPLTQISSDIAESMERLLKPSIVNWVMETSCSHGKQRDKKRVAFYRWLELQKESLIQDSSSDSDNILLQNPRCWVEGFQKWFVQQRRREAAEERRKRSASSKSKLPCIEPIYGAPSSAWVTPTNISHENSDVLRELRTSSQALNSSIFGNTIGESLPRAVNNQQQDYLAKDAFTVNEFFHRVKRENQERRASGFRKLNTWFMNSGQLQTAMNKFIPTSDQQKEFLDWIELEKSRLLTETPLNTNSVLFYRPPKLFKAYRKQRKRLASIRQKERKKSKSSRRKLKQINKKQNKANCTKQNNNT